MKNINAASQNHELLFNKNTLISIAIYLIDNCNFRVGCDKYKKLYNSYGVTTLNKSHIKMDKGKMIIEFVGKKGVQNKSNIKDKKICKLLTQICRKNNKNTYLKLILKKGLEYRAHKFLFKRFHTKIKVKMFRAGTQTHIIKEVWDILYLG